MFLNALASEEVAIVGIIDPDAYTQATYTTDYIDMSKWESVLCVVMAGDLGSSATIDAKVTEFTSDGGAGSHDITGKAITQLTQAGTDSNKQALINVRREDLDIDGGARYIKLSVTVGTATSDMGAVVLGVGARRNPASDNDLSAVDEIVA